VHPQFKRMEKSSAAILTSSNFRALGAGDEREVRSNRRCRALGPDWSCRVRRYRKTAFKWCEDLGSIVEARGERLRTRSTTKTNRVRFLSE